MRNNLAKRRIGLRRGPSGSKECGGEMGFEWSCVDVVVYIEGYYFCFI